MFEALRTVDQYPQMYKNNVACLVWQGCLNSVYSKQEDKKHASMRSKYLSSLLLNMLRVWAMAKFSDKLFYLAIFLLKQKLPLMSYRNLYFDSCKSPLSGLYRPRRRAGWSTA
ncbi:hypothetical protein ElyMa_005504600 [Elysia marginata]|uniref:Uncharacterized protein n=1 Tax=Elysia marginata TaxID=1093978 RepID=A0AAV4EU88_9GAST|nr:hypothetical protein ElyMa_005504600 [Elysia marginata]